MTSGAQSSVPRTHIVTSALTPGKIQDLKMMKIVRSEWLVESVAAQSLLPWTNYIYTPEAVYGGRTTQRKLITYTKAKEVPTTSTRPQYAAHASNPQAERAMSNTSWRAQHTSANSSDFIQGYYENSRLHHLSAWKSQLRVIVGDALKRVEEDEFKRSQLRPTLSPDFKTKTATTMVGTKLRIKTPQKGKSKGIEDDAQNTTVIMHVDFDCFFVSAGLTKHPHFRGKPVVVCHSQGATGSSGSTSEIASCSYEARAFGVKNGMR